MALKNEKLDNHNLPYKPSYPLDLFLWLENPDFDALVNRIIGEIEAQLERRAMDANTQEKFRFAVQAILLNLLKLRKLPLKTLLAIKKSIGAYSHKTRYDQRLASFRPLIEAYDGLLNLHYIEVTKPGWYDKKVGRGEVTRINATHKLAVELDRIFPQEIIIFSRHPDEENIRLREEKENSHKKGKLIDYDDNEYTKAARGKLAHINACLNRHWYDLELSNEQFDALYLEMMNKHKKEQEKPPSIDFEDRSLYRIYNNGSKENPEQNFRQGGRFYGGWWEGIPKGYRRYITINQKHTAEVDFANLHPQMLYAKEGLEMNGDAYLISGVKDRDMVKVAFNKLLNGKKKLDKPDDFEDEKVGMSWKRLLQCVEDKHKPISKYFRTGYGLDLQFKDSEIAERILLHYATRNIPCLPIHDSFIVHHDLQDELKELMLSEYQKEFGFGIKFKHDDNYDFFVKLFKGQGEELRPIEEILKEDQASIYERRYQSWLQQQ